jgi:inorganic phosphate transporter, PiT family
MTDAVLPSAMAPAARKGPNLEGGMGILSGILFGGVIAAGLLFVAYSIHADIVATGTPVTNYLPFLLRL